ncbi:hypothetical protein N657DRAFT_491219 [Parathielavia appendiculata]|uniref:Uncharacterized protein n=1 Tax=Parathielavia appendiculata TaxID=2587402 RepID=A0AAN6Z256_9PEZI|nr:hypothetical protein N657DRAFT_491219 [Parathielavia appendiculata]
MILSRTRSAGLTTRPNSHNSQPAVHRALTNLPPADGLDASSAEGGPHAERFACSVQDVCSASSFATNHATMDLRDQIRPRGPTERVHGHDQATQP